MIGMLWYDNSSKPFSDKVRDAVAAYRRRINQSPNMCYINATCYDNVDTVDGVKVMQSARVLKNHFYVVNTKH